MRRCHFLLKYILTLNQFFFHTCICYISTSQKYCKFSALILILLLLSSRYPSREFRRLVLRLYRFNSAMENSKKLRYLAKKSAALMKNMYIQNHFNIIYEIVCDGSSNRDRERKKTSRYKRSECCHMKRRKGEIIFEFRTLYFISEP